MCLIVSSSGEQSEVHGRLALLIAYLVANAHILQVDASSQGRLVVMWDKDYLRCRKQKSEATYLDLPPLHEPQNWGIDNFSTQ